jgi:hypothetical protein
VVDCGEVGRSAVYNWYNNCHNNTALGYPALTGGSSVYSLSTFTRKCLLCR